MSLDSLLSDPEVKALLKDRIVTPKGLPSPPILVDQRVAAAPRLGTAFDYALRFGLKARGSATSRLTVAEGGLLRLNKLGPHLVKQAQERLKAALSVLNSLSAENQLPKEAAIACFHLEGLDLVYRPGLLNDLMYEPVDDEIKTMQDLFRIVPWDQFRPKKHLLLNPVFNASERVGGADADIILDDVLIDIKTVAEARVDIKMVRQVVCYMLMANRDGVRDAPHVGKLTHGGIYFSRAGKLVTFPLEAACASSEHETVFQGLVGRWAEKRGGAAD